MFFQFNIAFVWKEKFDQISCTNNVISLCQKHELNVKYFLDLSILKVTYSH